MNLIYGIKILNLYFDSIVEISFKSDFFIMPSLAITIGYAINAINRSIIEAK